MVQQVLPVTQEIAELQVQVALLEQMVLVVQTVMLELVD
jgi:hypothetical protein